MVTVTEKYQTSRRFRGSGRFAAFLRSSASSLIAHRLLFVERKSNVACESRRAQTGTGNCSQLPSTDSELTATTYNTLGEATQIQSLNALGVVSTVQQTFDGLGDMTSQTTVGLIATAVDSNGNPDAYASTPALMVQYNYTFTPSSGGSAGSDRLASMVYPDGYTINYSYTNAADAALARPTSISESGSSTAQITGYTGSTLQEYTYWGMSGLATAIDPQPGVTETLTPGQFGQVAEQSYTNASNQNLDTNQYTYL
ncbi:MAG: hypothetical protein ACYCUV_14795 [Phycisphaerae bacterium]